MQSRRWENRGFKVFLERFVEAHGTTVYLDNECFFSFLDIVEISKSLQGHYPLGTVFL